MSNRNIVLVSVFTFLLFGCNSFNRNETYVRGDQRGDQIEEKAREWVKAQNAKPAGKPEDEDDKGKTKPPVVTPPKEGPKEALCPPYKPPSLERVPALPYKELEAAANNPEKIDEITMKHIEDLRGHIMRMRNTVMGAQTKYQNECRQYLQKEGR